MIQNKEENDLKKAKLLVSVSHEMKNKGHDALFVDTKSLNLIDHKQNSACVAVLHSKVFMGKAMFLYNQWLS